MKTKAWQLVKFEKRWAEILAESRTLKGDLRDHWAAVAMNQEGALDQRDAALATIKDLRHRIRLARKLLTSASGDDQQRGHRALDLRRPLKRGKL